MKANEILEAFNAGRMPAIKSDDYQESYLPILQKAKKLADVRKNLELFCYANKIYLLVKDEEVIVGNLNLSPQNIAGKEYLHVDGIFVREEYRKTAALYWLLYSVKEVLKRTPVIADGAMFTDGQALIRAIQDHSMFNAHKLNKDTGEKSELTGLITSDVYCYIFESTKLGFGKHFFEGTTLPFIWYPLFEELP
jgi:hypothetical protein